MINFYRRFIPGAAKILQPLNHLSKDVRKSNALIEWSKQTENVFRESKRALANASMLAHPVPGAPISLAVDASDFAIGAVLQQRVNNIWQLGLLTKSLTLAQRKYSELLAMYTAVKRSRRGGRAKLCDIYRPQAPYVHVQPELR
jgi:hypothetical protein